MKDCVFGLLGCLAVNNAEITEPILMKFGTDWVWADLCDWILFILREHERNR